MAKTSSLAFDREFRRSIAERMEAGESVSALARGPSALVSAVLGARESVAFTRKADTVERSASAVNVPEAVIQPMLGKCERRHTC